MVSSGAHRDDGRAEVRHATVVGRLLDGLREVGVLLLAFTPLDYVMQGGNVSRAAISALLAVGAIAFVASILIEAWKK